jgi:two-component system, cell cycle response regulator DivK
VTKVLIADDSASNRELLRTILTHCGCEVTEAADGFQAIEAADSVRPDLIILDIQMPRLDGYGTLARLRALEQFRKTPIIALTAYAMEGDDEKGRAAGFNDYVTKPVGLKKIRQVLDALLPNQLAGNNPNTNG